MRWPSLSSLLVVAGCATVQPAPVFDGHADFAIHYAGGDRPWRADRHDLATLPGQGGLTRWRAGRLGGMLTTVSSNLPAGAPNHYPALLSSLDWLDALGRSQAGQVALARSPQDVRKAWRDGKVALVAALEGAEQLDGDARHLSELHARGLRSLLIVYDGHNRYGDGANAFLGSSGAQSHGGLSGEGRALIVQANRLGILVDLSHAAETTALDAISASSVPVIFSHSGARALADTPRNLSDAVLRRVGETGGIVMVTLVPYLTTHGHWRWFDSGEREYARLIAAHGKSSPLLGQGMAAWDRANPEPRVTVNDVADQIQHVVRIAGHDHVGLGSDFDGMGRFVIPDLADASKLPLLFAELRRRGWRQAQLDALASGNFLRVWQSTLDRAER